MDSTVKEAEDKVVVPINGVRSAEDYRTQRQRNQTARRLLQEWMEDTSGYDEETWPEVRRILEENRLSPRSRFGD